MSDMVYISVDYDGLDPSTYRGVILRMGDEEERFCTPAEEGGSPTVDMLVAGMCAGHRLGEGGPIMSSSSVNHFVMDGGVLDDEGPSQEQVDQARVIARAYLISRGEGPEGVEA